MDILGERIAVIRGPSGAEVQAVFRALAKRWRPSVRLAGVIAEDHGLADRACSAGFLRNIASGERFSIFQDLGPGSTECHLDAMGALAAAEAVQRDIAAGCDLVLLSKFGKLEADGKGLLEAFKATIEAGIPLLTSVSPAFEEPWKRIAGPSFLFFPLMRTRSMPGGGRLGTPSRRRWHRPPHSWHFGITTDRSRRVIDGSRRGAASSSTQSMGVAAPVSRWCWSSHLPSTSRLII